MLHGTCEHILRDSFTHGSEQVCGANRLRQKTDGTGLHRLHAHRDAAMAGDKDDWPLRPCAHESPVQIEAAHVGHYDISDETAWCFWIVFRQKIERRCPR